MKFFCMGSGSSGNCYYLLDGNDGIIIDMGIGIRYLKRYFDEYGFALDRIRAVFVTHDHTDHVKSVGKLSAELGVPVYATESVHRGMLTNPFMHRKVDEALRRPISLGEAVEVGPFSVTAVHVPHDASDNSAYFVRAGGTTFLLITDAGRITEELGGYIRQAENLVIEANYDPAMLESGPYPKFLKRRISCGTGHSSNVETAAALQQYLSPEARRVWLCHLSEENNHPELARKTVETALQAAGLTPELCVLKRRVPSGVTEL
ncbi:MAG: MBL fold metallo-hydrolase [Alloprevotella sp.]|nr:MBL fold metallo-hydrolase [Alloprevotella sp.]